MQELFCIFQCLPIKASFLPIACPLDTASLGNSAATCPPPIALCGLSVPPQYCVLPKLPVAASNDVQKQMSEKT